MRLWTIFSIGKSTAIVVPILPLCLVTQHRLTVETMLQIASYFVLVPVLLDVPMGWLGDRIGHRFVLTIGTLIFLCGFGALLANTAHGYPIYLLCIGIAAACYSGANRFTSKRYCRLGRRSRMRSRK